VLAFLEKTEDPPTDQINAGTYIFNRSIIDRIPRGRAVSVEREVFPALLSDGVKVCGFVDSSYWRDMGTPRTSSAARPIWCAAWRRHPRSGAARRAWCTTGHRWPRVRC
jgi:mannose-1-phosphate guanylyltransferase